MRKFLIVFAVCTLLVLAGILYATDTFFKEQEIWNQVFDTSNNGIQITNVETRALTPQSGTQTTQAILNQAFDTTQGALQVICEDCGGGNDFATYLNITGATTPYLNLLNTTASDADASGKTEIRFQRTQSGGEQVTGFTVRSQHSGTGDDTISELLFFPATDSTGAVQILDADGGTPVVNVDSTNERVGIGIAAPNEQLELTGNLRVETDTANSQNGVIYKGATPFLHSYFPTNATGHNIFLGLDAGNFTATAAGATNSSKSIGIGYQALNSETTGYNNIAIGDSAMASSTGKTDGIAIGTSAMPNGGNYSISIGGQAGTSNTGQNNLYFGYNAGYYNVGGNGNLMFGRNAGFGTASMAISNNVILGYQAGFAVNTGADNNIMIGYQAANNLTTGEKGIFIGYDIDAQSTTADGQMVIGNLLFSNGIDGTGTTVSTGNLGIGVADPDTKTEILYAGDQLKLSFDGTDNTTFATDTNGDMTITPSGDEVTIAAAAIFGNYSSDPCGSLGTGSLWYNSSSDFFCFCDSGGDDLQVADGSACF